MLMFLADNVFYKNKKGGEKGFEKGKGKRGKIERDVDSKREKPDLIRCCKKEKTQ